ncbi:hypothetical protein BpJC7_15410 [Weizmannia acidilactici]|uniref:Uncharacterized protein n=1 Tax=Weizmannia acidilactici TaxID=2607726 RepID=A0A5J4JIF4_9BACI|nr:hypothetical protein [Weizmannia acidilactici]GER66541.1 hypothetical protein BpJC4_10120 [Weizmannia acidilactici]GER70238.1 hypothetical protein BpJC7_15410 [Weizmannia acidilactici]GER74561.1 hypothetical protein BpPP18_26280 [Weizmannia acidilactici]
MFGWLGWKTGWPLWRAYRRNQYLKEDVEEIFEGIAETRKQLLFHWTEENWSLLEKMEQQLSSTEEKNDENLERLFSSYLKRGQDFSELFLLDMNGRLLHIQLIVSISALPMQGDPLASLDWKNQKGKELPIWSICRSTDFENWAKHI